MPQIKTDQFPPTPEQEAIYNLALNSKENIIVNALAGAAKTTTIFGIANRLNKTAILCLAFNKKIAVEMQENLPSTAQAMTLNALGHRAWGQAIGTRLTVSTRKNFGILKKLIEQIKNPDEKSAAYDCMAQTLRSIAYGKSAGYVPTDKFKAAKGLLNDDELFEQLETEPSAMEERLIRQATIISIQQAFTGQIDFDDQVFMPTVFAAPFPQYPLIIIDEAQDLSRLNHVMLRKLVNKRLIAVGDPCQAIYGFRGAHQDSMDLMQSQWDMTPTALTISFRCAKEIVREARWRAPAMQYGPDAIEGQVNHITIWGADDIPDATAVICRNNAPLFNMAIKLLRAGRYPELIGNDIAKFLIKQLSKFGNTSLTQAEVYEAIDGWEEKEVAKSRNPGNVRDRAGCLRLFAEQGKTLGEILAMAKHITAVTGPIKLMTGHKSKGLEFENVFFLDQQLIKDQDEQQEKNLKYVIQTRAQKSLYYVTSAGFVSEEEEV